LVKRKARAVCQPGVKPNTSRGLLAAFFPALEAILMHFLRVLIDCVACVCCDCSQQLLWFGVTGFVWMMGRARVQDRDFSMDFHDF